jgi:hypothetical protein
MELRHRHQSFFAERKDLVTPRTPLHLPREVSLPRPQEGEGKGGRQDEDSLPHKINKSLECVHLDEDLDVKISQNISQKILNLFMSF